MKGIEVKEVIVCNRTTKGTGDKHSPIRRVTQVFEKDGTMIAEHDPLPETFVAFDLLAFTRWMISNYPEVKQNININHVHAWLDTFDKASNEGN